MSNVLYTTALLRLASDTTYVGRLSDAHASIDRRSATCGSRILTDVKLTGDGRIAAYGHEVRTCALGQASATLFARHAIGRSRDELVAAYGAVCAWLAGTRDNPGDWPGLGALAAARAYPARHAALRLPFEAAIEAVDQAQRRVAA